MQPLNFRTFMLVAVAVCAVIAAYGRPASAANGFVGLWTIDGAPWNGDRFNANGTVTEYDRGKRTGEFPYTIVRPNLALVRFGLARAEFRLDHGVLITHNLRRELRLHRANAISSVPPGQRHF
jgi:hypothetical protein